MHAVVAQGEGKVNCFSQVVVTEVFDALKMVDSRGGRQESKRREMAFHTFSEE